MIGDETDDQRYTQRHPEWFEQRDYQTLGDVLTGHGRGRRDGAETIVYDTISAGIQFAAVGSLVYEQRTNATWESKSRSRGSSRTSELNRTLRQISKRKAFMS